MRNIVVGVAIFAFFFTIALRVMDTLWPPEPPSAPAVVTSPPLAPMTTSSFLIAPIAVSDIAIREALEAVAPRDLAGKRDNPLADLQHLLPSRRYRKDPHLPAFTGGLVGYAGDDTLGWAG